MQTFKRHLSIIQPGNITSPVFSPADQLSPSLQQLLYRSFSGSMVNPAQVLSMVNGNLTLQVFQNTKQWKLWFTEQPVTPQAVFISVYALP